jgi:glyoxylate/hydroxypyruvate reductase A
MNLLFYCEGDSGRLLQAFREQLGDHAIYDWQNDRDIPHDQISAALVWMPPAHFFDGLSHLTHVYALSAGVDHLLNHPGLPESVTVHRLCDAGMAQQIAEYVLYGVLHAQRSFHDLRKSQAAGVWKTEVHVKSTEAMNVGLLGAGALGSQVAERLALNGYPVRCWSRSPRPFSAGITGFHGADALPEFLSRCDALVCLLPLTDATRGILDSRLFEQLPRGAYLINPGRGAHLVEKDLIGALDSGQLSGALLDVFHTEPLPVEHEFWQHSRIIVTPHVAAKTRINESVKQIIAGILAIEQGEIPDGIVDRQRGY